MRLPIVGLCLLVLVGVLVFAVERTGGSVPSAASSADRTPASSSVGTRSAGATPPSSARAAPSAGRTAIRSAVRHGDPLGNTAAAYLAGRSGAVLAAVYDLDTSQTWTIGNARQVQDEASVVKVDILETLFAQRHGARSATDQALAEQMIEDSDNDAATSLWDEVGGASGIRAYNTTLGLTGTTPSSCVQCPGFPWPGWGLTTTTPQDQIALLRVLVSPGLAVSAADREFALRLMENVTPSQRWGVSGGVPAQVTVALKNGWLPLNDAQTDWQINSVGWVSGLGRDYLIAVLSTGNPTEQYGIDTIDGLSAIVWDRLG
jgi:hypothetical protein